MGVLRLVGRVVLGRRLPITQGELSVPQLAGKVAIHRDRWGIPVIEATTPNDGWYGLGFCHGQDRTVQLEMQLRLSRGTLSELIGQAGVPVDRLIRRLGLGLAAETQLPQLAPEHRAILEAYTHGMNAAHRHGLSKLPHEFALLKSKPTPWMPADVLAFTKLTSFLLASNWDCELARFKLLVEFGPTVLTDLDPGALADHPVSIPPGDPIGSGAKAVLDALQHDLGLLSEWAAPGGGSNNWVIAGSKTATGKPILANDPHLAPILPNHYYLATIRTPNWRISGASFVGTPTFSSGHNGHIAWGLTAGLTDNTDLFLERLSADGRTYQQGERQEPCILRDEIIYVKDGEPVTERVRSTSRGPIISPALDGIAPAISIRATWLDAHPVNGWLGAQSCTDVRSFRRCFEQWPFLGQNIVYAHTDGTIGYQLAGQLPKRKRGRGMLPLPGWDDANGWHADLVPFEQMPHSERPEAGFITTANNPPMRAGDGPDLGSDFLDGYRAAILGDALQRRNDWDSDGCQQLQTDFTAMPWTEIRSTVLALDGTDPETFTAIELLRNWNGMADTDSPAATVYELFLARMAQRVVAAKCGDSPTGEFALGRGFSSLTPMTFMAHRQMGRLSRWIREQPPGWFSEGWNRVMESTLAEIIRELNRRFGPGPRWWAWGHLRPLVGRHVLMGTVNPWKAIFNRGPYPFGGDDNTPCQASVTAFDPLAPTENIPCVRVVMDVGQWQATRAMLFGGQSGNPYSDHYDDLIPMYLSGDMITIPQSPEEIAKKQRQTLLLRPELPASDDASESPSAG
ncbi:penicillin acylase family protein [Tuwongella immobilis]|uniref:Penicillin acylase family protein n=1 Tax=Tuwongella immobilis TaxID=692036 RepID=A0A6C2YJ54_9BACT|nr:penicillin acylase family protein [Tuwongella immobilis]VIP01580.1 peptidase s45 penicillin amidase : Penicillin acylase II OS=Thermomicrobium roseum (strain ATCC 27502 / DSM 5159 / P-2) GN=trd_1119 PE=4 SV=1: Penicil_amidase [Tuwongella immobilis]VTR98830.1 peptidase s45 penicillin amidase : Penicillin acylase II OS=Thermomicrobium roseum (strain ATCC 27502 / DSM 5159 / P-2) GN=trd_1119 PE=4 SV=1: Penicil_amidase [Tuwongella immobilis]